ncbi:DUF1028 domain-containing protein [Paraburkholderia sp. BCC1886]|uniref:DUF1028 domain-containing protein n=1 Tax=Paraburkholderia sp. BCC1886 TaxID=2562670 RepID=UPI00118249E5|nr:DUF1028 domain-containing protein [Paraburkholderia sp. BCC1886]
MTYSILAKCPDTGRYGLGIATYSVAVGQWCDGLDRYAGATMSQAFVRTTNNALALNLLRLGHSAKYVSDALVRDDDFASYRQIGVISADGSASCHSGEHTRGWAGHRIGDGYVAMGNVLSRAAIVEAMADAFEQSATRPFEERLLRALEAGRDAGGQGNGTRALPERSGALIVTASDHLDAVNLRVDLHPHAVDELRRVHSVCSQYTGYYRSRGINPPDAPGQEVFEQQNGIAA